MVSKRFRLAIVWWFFFFFFGGGGYLCFWSVCVLFFVVFRCLVAFVFWCFSFLRMVWRFLGLCFSVEDVKMFAQWFRVAVRVVVLFDD